MSFLRYILTLFTFIPCRVVPLRTPLGSSSHTEIEGEKIELSRLHWRWLVVAVAFTVVEAAAAVVALVLLQLCFVFAFEPSAGPLSSPCYVARV